MKLKLEVGKSYRRADGVKCTVVSDNGGISDRFLVDHGGVQRWHRQDGVVSHKPSNFDLIAEWEEPPLPHGHARLPCGKVVDLTNPYGTPFGLLDEVYGAGTQEAMRAHGGPIEFYNGFGWRVVELSVWLDRSTYRIAPKREPKTWWIVDGCEAWDTEHEARANAGGREVVKVVEVME